MTTSSISTFIRIAPRLPRTTSILLRGNHGIGKSQVVRQAAAIIAKEENLNDYEVIDRRLSQMSEGDMIGLPSTDGNVTRFNPPDWYARACDKPCALFLDELNRATPEVMQAAFQIVLDRQLNGRTLHPQTRVFSAINNSSAYSVNEVDPALLDRFFVVDLEPTVEEWITWARGKEDNKERVHYGVVDFIQGAPKFLYPAKNYEPGTVQPSPRSWERLSDALIQANIAEEPEHEDFYVMSMGYVGTESAIAFTEYSKNTNARVSGEEILNEYAKVKKKINRLGQEKLNVAIDKVVDYAVNKMQGKLTAKHGKNLAAFTADLPGELVLSLWGKLTTRPPEDSKVDHIELVKFVHSHMVDFVMKIFQDDPTKLQGKPAEKTQDESATKTKKAK